MAAAVWAEVMTGRFVSCSGCDVGWLIQATGAVRCWKSIRACRKNRRAAEWRFRGGQGELNIAPTVKIISAFKIKSSFLSICLLSLFFIFLLFNGLTFVPRSASLVCHVLFQVVYTQVNNFFRCDTSCIYEIFFKAYRKEGIFNFTSFSVKRQTNLKYARAWTYLSIAADGFHHCNQCFKADFREQHVSTLQRTNTLCANLLPDLVPTHLLVHLLRALPCCSIAAEQSQSCLLVPMVHLSESCEHARVYVCVCVSPLCVCVCLCVWETESERERDLIMFLFIHTIVSPECENTDCAILIAAH